MLTHLADVSARSILLAIPVAVALRGLRSRRTAALQHALWTAVVCGMLLLFLIGSALPRLPLRILDRSNAAVAADPPAVSADAIPLSEAAEAERLPGPAPATAWRAIDRIDWIGVLTFAYGAIAFAFLAQFVTGMFLVRKLLAKSNAGQNFLESDLISVPMTVGWLRPRILLPLEWREWDREKLEAVLAHEGAHVRRRDGLVAALAAINRCIFWFHPLAWMLERKLALLSELACDEWCVAALGDRQRYAQLLLEMASAVDGSRGRLRYHALTMAAGSHLGQRIAWLLQEGGTFSRGLSWMGWAAVMLCGIPLVWGTGAVELDRRPPLLSLELPRWSVPAPPVLEKQPLLTRVMVAQAKPTPPPQAAAPLPPAPATAKFEVASVKPCKQGDTAGTTGQKGGRGGGGGIASPDRLDMPCLPLRFFIQLAYIISVNQLNPDANLRLEGGPAWIDSEHYQIDAKTDGPVGRGTMQGPMLQALLEDRFKLKIRRETRETPLYALTVAKGGLKLQRAGDRNCTEPDAGGAGRDGRPFLPLGCNKLQPTEEGSCTPRDPTQLPPPRQPGQMPFCGLPRGLVGAHRYTEDLLGAGMAQIARVLGSGAGRPVIDQTGITEKFDFHIEFAPDGAAPSDDPGAPPSVFAALQQMGLKLEPAKGPRDFLVIDHVERPSEN